MYIYLISLARIRAIYIYFIRYMQCYYIGGLKESATSIIGTMSKPVSWGMPADKICFKLYKKDRQICELKYGRIAMIVVHYNEPSFL